MSDIVERLRKWSVFGYGYEASCDMKEAATAIEAQQANMANAARLLSEQAAEIERLRTEVKVWQGHAKTAVWSDSEECKMLTAEVERLLKSRNRWAKKYNDLLAKRRISDGYDVYAAAREEYRKKIAEQAARIERLEAALQYIAWEQKEGDEPHLIARAALEERT